MFSKSFKPFQEASTQRIEIALGKALAPETQSPTHLHSAMRYAVMGGGKRIRALLVYATGQLFNIPAAKLDPIACAVELIHAYSLIHDDLPAMDDDDLRRGKASCHKAFDEATAILAGDALQALAFKVLTQCDISAEHQIACIRILADASGSSGMVGGQAIDLKSSGQHITLEQLEHMHQLKTGALISACVTLVSSLELAHNSAEFSALNSYARDIGLAFQVQDDILDETSSTASLGKTQGKDKDAAKSTYLSLLGLEKSRELTKQLQRQALASLAVFDHRADNLKDIAQFTISRLS
jgi:farnesyl diphosphate synthase